MSATQQRIENIEMIRKLQEVDREEMERNEDYREPLSIDTFVEKRIFLSFGGPSDGFKLTFSVNMDGKTLSLSHGVYFRADWGTYEESQLRKDEAEMVFEFYMGGEATI